jgi:hypothetical protein
LGSGDGPDFALVVVVVAAVVDVSVLTTIQFFGISFEYRRAGD